MVFWSSEAPREIHVEEMGYLTEMKWNVPETTDFYNVTHVTLKSFKFLNSSSPLKSLVIPQQNLPGA